MAVFPGVLAPEPAPILWNRKHRRDAKKRQHYDPVPNQIRPVGHGFRFCSAVSTASFPGPSSSDREPPIQLVHGRKSILEILIRDFSGKGLVYGDLGNSGALVSLNGLPRTGSMVPELRTNGLHFTSRPEPFQTNPHSHRVSQTTRLYSSRTDTIRC